MTEQLHFLSFFLSPALQADYLPAELPELIQRFELNTGSSLLLTTTEMVPGFTAGIRSLAWSNK